MELEEAKKNCNDYVDLILNKNYCDCNELNYICHGKYGDGSKNVAQSIEIILQALENSISKDKVREKIEELEAYKTKLMEEDRKPIHNEDVLQVIGAIYYFKELLEDK